MLLFIGRFAWFAQGIIWLSYVQFWGLTATGLVRKHLSTFKFFLETVLVKSFKSFNVVRYVVLWLRLWFRRNLFNLFFRWWPSRIGQIVKSFGLLSIALYFKLSSDDFFEIVGIPIILSSLFYISHALPSNCLRRLSYSNLRWHCLIFFSMALISWLTSAELFFMIMAALREL